MHVDASFVINVLIFVSGALWRGVHAVSPVPSVPPRVPALAGSCVVIPCSFAPSAAPLGGRKERMDVRVRFRGGGHLFPLRSTAFNSEDRDQVSRDFQGRSSLVGQTSEGDCSVRISRVNRDDLRVFEIALKRGGDLLWGKPRTFSLEVTDRPNAPVIGGISAFTEGQLVTLNCSVDFSCVSKPPSLIWSWDRGAQLNSTEPRGQLTLFPQPHRPVLVSTLSFTATHQVQPRVRCEAKYPGGKNAAALKDLHVTFSPKDVRVHVQTLSVHEGGSALVSCSCKADPPASEYHWSYVQHGLSVHLHQKTHTVRLHNVTRDTRVRCSALNLIGQGESPPLLLNVQYKPTILEPSSFCVWDGAAVLCDCTVQSNPGPSITWSVNGSVPPEDYNISFTSHSHALKATMRGHMGSVLPVVCYAVNALGNDSALLLLGREADSALLWLILPAVAICFMLLIFSIGFCCYCFRNRTKKRMLRRHLAAYPENHGIYQDRMPLYINCTEVTHIYTNGSYQLVYQNCTPCFVRTKQIRPMGRRGGERRRGAERGARERQTDLESGQTIQTSPAADADTAIYLEIL
ncbi:sialic acid-binding Ig-like lectin 5 [Eucyclogobius newberryi]|uniref:sialic acid-binding Ig-like lectin 5 n=1 Tax=Eucyclogobius newberryi TaxID=166745 RepID=UPI003B5BBF0C